MERWTCPQEWSEWSNWLAAGLHGRCRWRLSVLLMGLLFAQGRRTVTSWLRAAGVIKGVSSYYYFIAAVGRQSAAVAEQLVVLLLRHLSVGEHVLVALDDSPTKHYGPKIQGAGIHRNPTPGPTATKYLYGHIWVTLVWIGQHAQWGTIGLPLRALLYIRQVDVAKLPVKLGWKFLTKLQLGLQLVTWLAELLQRAGKRLRVVADGAYAKRPFVVAARKAGITVISRLRRDAALRSVPPPPPPRGQRGPGRPRKYGRERISLAKRAGQKKGWSELECRQYGQLVQKKYKTFLATYRPAGGVIRVVIVQEARGAQYFFSTDPQMSAGEIIEAMADRSAIEQDFHDVKEVWGAAQQQVRYLWASIGCWHLNLWMHTLVELWAWRQGSRVLRDRRDSPWDDPARRPSHADHCKALRRLILTKQFSFTTLAAAGPRKLARLARQLIHLAA